MCLTYIIMTLVEEETFFSSHMVEPRKKTRDVVVFPFNDVEIDFKSAVFLRAVFCSNILLNF